MHFASAEHNVSPCGTAIFTLACLKLFTAGVKYQRLKYKKNLTMKNILYFLGALLVCAGCSTERTASRSMSSETTALAYRQSDDGQGGTTMTGRGSTVTGGTEEGIMTVTIGSPTANQTQTTTTQTMRSDQTIQTGQGGTSATVQERIESDQAEIPLHKEELVVGKREVGNGSVIVRKVVKTENVSQPVQLRREEYTIERVPASEAQNRAGNAFQAQEILIPLRREEAVVGKRALLTEMVRIGKRVETDRQTITQPVRTENVEVVKNAGAQSQVGSATGMATTGNITGESSQTTQTTSPQNADNALQLAREELLVGKREVSNGSVLLRKVVQTQQASQPLDLRREEFVIDRSPANNQQANNADFRNQEIRIDLFREEPVVSTRSFVTEVVRLRKTVETDSQTISDTIRHENVEIVRNDAQGNTRETGAMINRTETGQGGTSISSQGGTITESGMTERSLENNPLRTRPLLPNSNTSRQPIPPPKGGEVLQFQDFDGVPTEHR